MQPLSYKFRIYPTAEQARILSAWQVACWEVQRLCVIERRQHSGYMRRCKVRGVALLGWRQYSRRSVHRQPSSACST
jgi:hypothetical protein